MKVKSISVLMMAAVAFLIMGLSVSPLQASQYLGEIRWTGTNSEGETITAKAAISRINGPYYEAQGQATTNSGETDILVGGGLLVGTQLQLTANVTETTSGALKAVSIMRVTINQTTFNATFWQINSWYDGANFGANYVTGTLTCTSNPFPLVPNSQAATSLMLLN